MYPLYNNSSIVQYCIINRYPGVSDSLSQFKKNKGSIDDPDNNYYRGITLLSCLGKLFTSTINTRLTEFIKCSGSLGEEHAGFRGYSTSDHIVVLSSLIELLSRRKRLYCAFVDYKKAFDLIDRASLWSKLLLNGIKFFEPFMIL